jgi:HEAT repeat protein
MTHRARAGGLLHRMNTNLLWPLVLCCGVAAAQDLPTSPALERAIAAFELEHDLPRAKELLRALAGDAGAPDAVRRHAWLKLAQVLRRAGADAGDALARAAAGDDAVARAAQALVAEQAQDPKRAEELEKQARAAIARVRGGAEGVDILWFGDAAVRPLLEEFERELKEGGHSYAPHVLWRLPGERAGRALRELLAAPEVERRRHVARGVALRRSLTGDLAEERREELRIALRDSDAEVAAAALGVGSHNLTLEDLLRLAIDGRDAVRLKAVEQLAEWSRLRFNHPVSADMQRDAETIAPVLARLLEVTRPEEYAAGKRVLMRAAGFSRAGREVLVRALPSLRGPDVGVPHLAQLDVVRNENATALRAALSALGPSGSADAAARVGAEGLTSFYTAVNWDREAMPTALLAHRLGYAQVEGWVEKHLRAEDAPYVVSSLAGSDTLRRLTPWLAQHDLPESAFPALRDALGDKASGLDESLAVALGRTGHPEAAAFLRAYADRRRLGLGQVARALCWLAVKRPDDTTREHLRAATFAMVGTLEPEALFIAFATLVRLGDEEVLRRHNEFAGAFRRHRAGVRESLSQPLASVPCGAGWPADVQISSPLDVLTSPPIRRDGAVAWWHGYSVDRLAQFWSSLLTPAAGGYEWDHAQQMVDSALQDAEKQGPVLAAIAQACGALMNIDVEASVGSPVGAVVRQLFTAHEKGGLPAAVAESVARLRPAAFQAKSAKVRAGAVSSILAPVDADDRARLLAALADPQAEVGQAAMRAVSESNTPVDRELLAAATRSAAPDTRALSFRWLREAKDDVTDLLRELAADPHLENRRTALEELAKSLRLDAVPTLLAALKDLEPRVREMATQGLQAIRFYHDEKAHWDRAFAGRAGLTTPSAAAALLEQAKPGVDAATRVLAIRSLGVLGAPETQPFLIEWTKDADAEVAAAAREAVGRIHAR